MAKILLRLYSVGILSLIAGVMVYSNMFRIKSFITVSESTTSRVINYIFAFFVNICVDQETSILNQIEPVQNNHLELSDRFPFSTNIVLQLFIK